ncbi:transcription factor GTE9-like [Cornus florida]|uniref:transcription factor GTE9-like n=1 Tax=Cornus florida TaxID=4283 RepID=UPI002899DB6B|nr:transcription factor GTE9-like [Cornus florida]
MGGFFNQPVDPQKLKIPDYFSIISEPMDLGTIKSKLEKNVYFSIDEFVSDVRLTFSNAMLYKPPKNAVHVMAKELNDIFNTKWKYLEAKWNCATTNIESKRLMPSEEKKMSSEEKKNLRRKFVEVSTGKMPRQLHCFLQKFGFSYQKVENIKVDVNALDDESFCELERLMRSCLDARTTKAGKAYQVKMHQEKERLERLQDKVKGRIESQIGADKAVSQMIAKARKMMRERDREAARLSLQKMEKTVEFEDNLQIVKYLGNLDVFGSKKPLEDLGLFLKNDDFYEEEEVIDVEEGEILALVSNQNSYHRSTVKFDIV